jgi:hypothetical protein
LGIDVQSSSAHLGLEIFDQVVLRFDAQRFLVADLSPIVPWSTPLTPLIERVSVTTSPEPRIPEPMPVLICTSPNWQARVARINRITTIAKDARRFMISLLLINYAYGEQDWIDSWDSD